MVVTPALSGVCWDPCWRLVSSAFPPKNLFERVTSTEDLEIVMRIEGLTNDRLREEIGELSLVPEEDRIFGDGTSPVMAAFTHLNPSGSRFSDGTFGVYYAAKSIHTAIAETRFHKERFLSATKEEPTEVDMRSYASTFDTTLHDIRGQQAALPDVYDPDPDHYAAGQGLAKSLRADGSNGIVYDSVRDQGGECVVLFRPRLLSPATQAKHFCYVWNGLEINNVYEKSEYVKAN